MNYFEISMFIIFILVTIGMMVKIKSWMPTEPLPDDDRDEKSVQELEEILIDTIKKEYHEGITPKEIFQMMQTHTKFDKKHYWRVNENRVTKLLEDIIAKHDGINSIYDIKERL